MLSDSIKTLILGNNSSIFQLYLNEIKKHFILKVVGFVFVGDEIFEPIRIKDLGIDLYCLRDLENKIRSDDVTKCVFCCQNISDDIMNAITLRVTSTGKCGIDFFSMNINFTPLKGIIDISSEHQDSESKTGFIQYLFTLLIEAIRKRVRFSVVINYLKLDLTKREICFSELPKYEFLGPVDSSRKDLPPEIINKINKYISCGAHAVFFSHNIRWAIMNAEQKSDVIIFENYGSSFVNFQTTREINKLMLPICLISPRKDISFPGRANFIKAKFLYLELLDETDSSLDAFLSMHRNKTIYKYYRKIKSKKLLVLAKKQNNLQGFINKHKDDILMTFYNEDDLRKYLENDPRFDLIITDNLKLKLTGKNSTKVRLTTLDMEKNTIEKLINNNFVPTIKNKFRQYFQNQVDLLERRKDFSFEGLSTQNIVSNNMEINIKLFLESILPEDYKVLTGEVVDSYNNITGQLDVVIVNNFMPTLTLTDGIIAPILADNVLSVIEVKTSLHPGSLTKALNQMRPVRALMPLSKSIYTTDGRRQDDLLEGKILCGIVSFRDILNIKEKAFDILLQFPNVIDYIVIPVSFGIFSVKVLDTCGVKYNEKNAKKGYVLFQQPKGICLTILYMILNKYAECRRYSSIPNVNYIFGEWGTYTGELEEKIKKISGSYKVAQSSYLRYISSLSNRN